MRRRRHLHGAAGARLLRLEHEVGVHDPQLERRRDWLDHIVEVQPVEHHHLQVVREREAEASHD